jgi:hypothetical protein
MTDIKESVERIINEKFDVIEERLRTSFQLVSDDIDKIKTKVIEIRDSNKIDEKLNELKEKISTKFSGITEEVENIKEKAVTKGNLDDEKKIIEDKMDRFRKETTKVGIKEDLYEKLGTKLEEKFKKIKDEEITGLRSQINFLKSRLNILQQSLNEAGIKECKIKEKSDKTKDKKSTYKSDIKKLPVENVKYNKDGVKPSFISKIIDSL